jgi:dipeptidase
MLQRARGFYSLTFFDEIVTQQNQLSEKEAYWTFEFIKCLCEMRYEEKERRKLKFSNINYLPRPQHKKLHESLPTILDRLQRRL